MQTTARDTQPTNLWKRGGRTLATLLACAAITGCEVDSYFDPTVTGRWEHTPTIVPILDRIAIIESDTITSDDVDYSDVETADLLPDATSYEIGVGDVLNISVRGLYQLDVPELFQRVVDERGQIDIPQFGAITVNGLRSEQIRDLVRATVRPIIADADVSVVVVVRQSQTYTILGVGRFTIGKPDLRLLEATGVQGINQRAEHVYVIRQTPLYDPIIERGNVPDQPSRPSGGPAADASADGEGFLDRLDQLQGSPPVALPSAWDLQPGEVKPRDTRERLELESTGDLDAPPPVIDLDGSQTIPTSTQAQPQTPADPDAQTPVIDIDGAPVIPAAQSQPQTRPAGLRWKRIDGRWVKVPRDPRPTTPNAGAEPTAEEARLLTQRVIRIPFQKVLRGNPDFNIVVRPGDVIRIPFAEQELVYLSGEINQPGPIQLQTGMTIDDAIESAGGGIGPLGIPERIDLKRRIGDDRQATVRLNYRAIREGTQPNIFLKANDHITIGTNALASPLAVIRNGFRASYGFGFLLDRNFGNDVFGAPPTNRNN